MAAVAREDPDQVRAAQILVSLRDRKLRRCPEWVPMQQPREASSSSPPGTVAAAAAKMMPPSTQAASSSAGTVAARLVVPLRKRPPDRVISMQSVVASSLSLAGAVAAGVPDRWPKAKRSGSRGETSKALPEEDHAATATAAAAAAAAKGSGAPRCSEQERCAEAEMPAAASAPVAAALCYATVARSGTGPSTSAAAPANKEEEAMKTPSPNSPLDYGSGADDAAPAPARPQAKRKGAGDDEGCISSPAKRGLVAHEAAEEEKPMPISVEPSVQSQTRASGGKAAPRPFDLNLLPCALDDDDR